MDLAEPTLSWEPFHGEIKDDGNDETHREAYEQLRVLSAGSEHLVGAKGSPENGLWMKRSLRTGRQRFPG